VKTIRVNYSLPLNSIFHTYPNVMWLCFCARVFCVCGRGFVCVFIFKTNLGRGWRQYQIWDNLNT